MYSAQIAVAASLALGVAACPGTGRDVVPETRDQRGPGPDGAAPATPALSPGEGYAYVARRPHGAVGLLGAHFMDDADARRVVDRVADELEICARRLEASGALASGAASLVAIAGPRGNAEISDIRFAPGGAVAANALECIVAPLRASSFPSGTDAGVAAVAIEATWAPVRSGKPDAGASL